jgi:hypothetical protein
MPLAAWTPTNSEPTRPGPQVTATASIAAKDEPASETALAITGQMFSM